FYYHVFFRQGLVNKKDCFLFILLQLRYLIFAIENRKSFFSFVAFFIITISKSFNCFFNKKTKEYWHGKSFYFCIVDYQVIIKTLQINKAKRDRNLQIRTLVTFTKMAITDMKEKIASKKATNFSIFFEILIIIIQLFFKCFFVFDVILERKKANKTNSLSILLNYQKIYSTINKKKVSIYRIFKNKTNVFDSNTIYDN
ncbi:hypothetical protein RFI_39233, partial [Reticulomyxa filosa]